MMPAGSFALRLNKTKLAIDGVISPPALLVSVAGGALAEPNVEAGGLTHN